MLANNLIREGSRIVSRTYGNVWSPLIERSGFVIIYKGRRSLNNSIKAASMLVSRGEQVCHIPLQIADILFNYVSSQRSSLKACVTVNYTAIIKIHRKSCVR